MNNDKSVQKIFDKLIAAELYHEHNHRYMCNAVEAAWLAGTITTNAYKVAKAAIRKYMKALGGNLYTLSGALDDHGLPSKFGDRLAIYKDWANRPMLEVEHE